MLFFILIFASLTDIPMSSMGTCKATINEHIVSKTVYVRRKMDISVADICRMCGYVNPKPLYNIEERFSSISVSMVFNLAKCYGIDPEFFFSPEYTFSDYDDGNFPIWKDEYAIEDMGEYKKTIGRKINTLKNERDWSLQDMCDFCPAVGDRRSLHDITKGLYLPKIDNIYEFAYCFNVDPIFIIHPKYTIEMYLEGKIGSYSSVYKDVCDFCY